MNYQKTQELITKAIAEKRLLHVRQFDTTFDMDFEPYLLGSDFLQQSFVWGYFPFNQVYYKLYFSHVESIKLTNQTFTPPTNLQYYFADQEETYASVEIEHYWSSFGPQPK